MYINPILALVVLVQALSIEYKFAAVVLYVVLSPYFHEDSAILSLHPLGTYVVFVKNALPLILEYKSLFGHVVFVVVLLCHYILLFNASFLINFN